MEENTKEKRAELFKGANDEEQVVLLCKQVNGKKEKDIKSFFLNYDECLQRIALLRESKRFKYTDFKIYDREFNQSLLMND